ncbi:MAG TPA: sulfurtransferase TusA family protein [Candidatus Tenderia sp.]|nr:sulfurtransferase TusA family protein [Candidatus Tenderia sp.]
MTLTVNQELDTSGMSCPLPVLCLKQALKKMASGQVLHVVATDKGTQHDFVVFSKQTGHELIESSEAPGKFHYWFRKA